MYGLLQEPICYGNVSGTSGADLLRHRLWYCSSGCYGNVWCASGAVLSRRCLGVLQELVCYGSVWAYLPTSPGSRDAERCFLFLVLSFVPPRSRSCSQSSHHALSSSPACTHTPRCIRTPTLCAGLAFRMSFSGTTSRRWRVRPFSEHACALEGRVLVVSPESRTCLEHALHGFAELAWPSPLVAVQVVTSRSAGRLGPPVLARLAWPCLNRLRESWTCPAGTRPPRASTPAPALSPTVLGRPLDAVARRRGPRLRPVRADPDVVNSRRVVRCSPARLLRRARDQTRRPRRGQSTGRSR